MSPRHRPRHRTLQFRFLVVSPDEDAADCPRCIDGDLKNYDEGRDQNIERKHDDMFHTHALSKMGCGVVKWPTQTGKKGSDYVHGA